MSDKQTPTTVQQATHSGSTLSTSPSGDVVSSGGASTVAGGDVVDQSRVNADSEANAGAGGLENFNAAKAALQAEQAASEEETSEAGQTEWDTRDKSKDVPVTDEQKARIASLGFSPEQAAAMEEFTLEANTTSTLSAASRDRAAEKFGVPRALVDLWVADVIESKQGASNTGTAQTQQAAASAPEQITSPDQLSPEDRRAYDHLLGVIHEQTGGAENWDAFAQWANNGGLTGGELQDLQASLGLNEQSAKRAVGQYYAKFKSEGGAGNGPKIDLSRAASVAKVAPQTVAPFKTREEANEAMRDKRYRVDTQYTNEVRQRFAISRFQDAATGQGFGFIGK